VEVVHISGGELESPDAGDPARLIRLRYREAAELVRVRGKMAVLMINDLDAGAGRFDGLTQYTVNTQLVNNTLMNIADNPTNVQLPGSYDETPLPRIPIVVTGNDFATLYAPLIRDGRMEKFYWEPDHDDRLGIVGGIFAPDGLTRADIETLVDEFPTQAIDFYGALRAQIYDEQIVDFIHAVGVENVSRSVVNTTKPPQFKQPNFRIAHLIEVGNQLVREQRRVQEMSLVSEYNQALTRTARPGQAEAHMAQKANGQFYRTYASDANSASNSNATTMAAAQASPERNARASDAELSSLRPSLTPETQQQVHNLLAQGYRVGMEHVDERRFRTNSWQSCTILDAQDDTQAFDAMERCLTQYSNEYVRLIGIDPKNKQRVLETIIQRPS
ncbi:MAG: AAA family ATPase, partial [Leptolyngbya sp. SIO4C1]|nr:AAA family ATPase [Leptolyngbya sp. SIO4C1]